MDTFRRPLSRLFTLILLTIALLGYTASAAQHTTTLWAWPLSDAAPKELAHISYDTDDLTSAVTKYNPPSKSKVSQAASAGVADDMVRVGLYDPKTQEWRGSVTSAESFHGQFQRKVSLHLDDNGLPFHVSFNAYPIPKAKKDASASSKEAGKTKERASEKQTEDGPLLLELLKPNPGPMPHLNRPVVLDPQGKAPAEEQEKTFLQKYWWAIAGFMVIQLVMAGGKGES